MKNFLKKIGNYFIDNWQTWLKFFIVLIAGYIVVKIVLAIIKRGSKKTKLNKIAVDFLLTVTKVVMFAIYLIVLLSLLGVPTVSLVATLSVFGLAVSLALQNTFSNFASGFVIISAKSFLEGDYVEIGGVSGTVKKISIFSTKITTPDNKDITIPNSNVVLANIINYSSEKTRRVDVIFNVAYGTNTDKVKMAINQTIYNMPKILSSPPHLVRLNESGESSLKFVVKVWVNNGDYWDTLYSLNENILDTFAREGIKIPYSQLDVHIK